MKYLSLDPTTKMGRVYAELLVGSVAGQSATYAKLHGGILIGVDHEHESFIVRHYVDGTFSYYPISVLKVVLDETTKYNLGLIREYEIPVSIKPSYMESNDIDLNHWFIKSIGGRECTIESEDDSVLVIEHSEIIGLSYRDIIKGIDGVKVGYTPYGS